MTKKIKFGEKLTGKNRYKRLYHYTSFDSFVRIWCTQTLKLGDVKNVNDIQEKDIPVITSNPQQIAVAQTFAKMRAENYKQLSFTMDYDTYLKGCMSPMMWGYYGGKCSGVCIEFEFNKLKFPNDAIKGPIRYITYLKRGVKLPTDLASKNDIKRYIKKYFKDLFLIKQSSWSGENEYRVVCPNLDYLDISGAISAVYLTSYESIECKIVEKLLENTDIPVKFLHYISVGKDNISMPRLTDTKQYREKMESAKNNPNNALAKITRQADDYAKEREGDENASLIKKDYIL